MQEIKNGNIMQTLKKNLKEGFVAVKLENLDDLWHLERLLEKGDLITARTKRKKSIKRGQEVELAEKRPMTLTLELEKTEYHKDTHSLRLMGIIQEGPDDVQLHSYHTIVAEPGLFLTIKKEAWKPHHFDRLNKARIKEPLILICLVDRDRADFAGLVATGIDWMGSINAKKVERQSVAVGSKQERSELFYKEIISKLEKEEHFQNIVLAGPGFERENLYHYIEKNNPALSQKIFLEHTSSIGKPGVQEVIKLSVNRVLKKTRIAKETQTVEDLLTEIAKEGLAVYGKEKVENALDFGAIEKLLVSEEHIKEYEGLMVNAEKMNGTVMIISTGHEAGEKFLSIGGIAAFLRFRPR